MESILQTDDQNNTNGKQHINKPNLNIYSNFGNLKTTNSKSEQNSFGYTEQHLFEIKRIQNAQTNHEKLGISMNATRLSKQIIHKLFLWLYIFIYLLQT